jgi:hypothetical protein
VTPEELRRAARHARSEALDLRRLASRLEASHVHQLAALSGDRTWLGPTATAFQDALRWSEVELRVAAADARRAAGRREQEACDLDRAAALPAVG